MRNFEERKAEIFHRSEQRIKERKRIRNATLTLCIPLCLVLTIWSVTMFPKMLSTGTTFDKNTENMSRFESVVITSFRESDTKAETITDSDKVIAIYGAIMDLYQTENFKTFEDGSDNKKSEFQEEDLVLGDASTEVEYAIYFTTADGTEIRFVINGNELRNTKNGNRVQLSKEQRNELLELLELAE